MNRRGFLLALLLAGSGIATAQETLSKQRYGVWMGPMATTDAPLPKGFAPFYPRLLWTRALGERDICTFADTGDYLITVEAERDKETKRAKPGEWRVYARHKESTRFAASQEIPALSVYLTGKKEGSARLFALPKSDVLCLRGDFDDEHFQVAGNIQPDGGYVPASDILPKFSSSTAPSGIAATDKEIGFLAASQTGTTVTFFPQPANTDISANSARQVRVPVRNAPVSAATVGEFIGGRTAFVAALGSGGNGPVAFAALHGKQELPGTEEEFAPNLLAAWQIPGRALPYLVTARNIGAEEGTDTPTGRAYLSLYNADAARWITVWESPALGQSVLDLCLASNGQSLLVLYRAPDGTVQIASLAA